MNIEMLDKEKITLGLIVVAMLTQLYLLSKATSEVDKWLSLIKVFFVVLMGVLNPHLTITTALASFCFFSSFFRYRWSHKILDVLVCLALAWSRVYYMHRGVWL